MNEKTEMPEIDPSMPRHAVSVYGDGAMDDFPVLRAFQQYIDAEQSKSRKRMLTLCAVFGFILALVIAAFATMLFGIGERNQQLNDRLVEFAMKDRGTSPVVVQSPAQDSAALLALTTKLDAMEKKLAEEKAKSEQAAREAARAREEAAKPKGPSKEQLEIKRLNALLDAEKEKAALAKVQAAQAAAAEKERKHQEELEAYRRKHYPELYETTKPPVQVVVRKQLIKPRRKVIVENDDADLDDDDAISYFDDEEDDDDEITVRKSKTKKTAKRSTTKPTTKTEPKRTYSIPVDVRGTSTSWQIPND